MKRETQNVLLVLTGGALVKIALGGSYLRYVQPAQLPFLVAGGLIILALAAVAIVRDIRAARQREREASGEQDPCGDLPPGDLPPGNLPCGHTTSGHARSAWFLLLPVLAIFVIAPPALGSDSVRRDSSRTTDGSAGANRPMAAFPPLPRAEVVPLELNEFVARAGWDSRDSLHGRTVRLTGFVVRDGGDVLLARLVIACCAADASPVTVGLRGNTPGGGVLDGLRSDEWIKVTGQLVPDNGRQDARYEPDLRVHRLHRIPEPDYPYEQ